MIGISWDTCWHEVHCGRGNTSILWCSVLCTDSLHNLSCAPMAPTSWRNICFTSHREICGFDSKSACQTLRGNEAKIPGTQTTSSIQWSLWYINWECGKDFHVLLVRQHCLWYRVPLYMAVLSAWIKIQKFVYMYCYFLRFSVSSGVRRRNSLNITSGSETLHTYVAITWENMWCRYPTLTPDHMRRMNAWSYAIMLQIVLLSQLVKMIFPVGWQLRVLRISKLQRKYA